MILLRVLKISKKYLGISTLALIPMNQAEEETASRRRSPGKVKRK